MEPEDALIVFCWVVDTEAPTAAARPPSRTAVRIDWTCRKASPNPMIPNTSMNSRGAINASSTAEAPCSCRSRLPTDVLPVQGLERLVERHRVARRALLDRLVGDPQLAQPDAALDESLEPHEVDAGSGVRGPHGRRLPVLLVPPEQAHGVPLPSPVCGCSVKYPPGALRRIRRKEYPA